MIMCEISTFQDAKMCIDIINDIVEAEMCFRKLKDGILSIEINKKSDKLYV